MDEETGRREEGEKKERLRKERKLEREREKKVDITERHAGIEGERKVKE